MRPPVPNCLGCNGTGIIKIIYQFAYAVCACRCIDEPIAQAKTPFDGYADPTPEQLASPEFEAIWQAIKSWDIGVPERYVGHTGALGNHVVVILDALSRIRRAD